MNVNQQNEYALNSVEYFWVKYFLLLINNWNEVFTHQNKNEKYIQSSLNDAFPSEQFGDKNKQTLPDIKYKAWQIFYII